MPKKGWKQAKLAAWSVSSGLESSGIVTSTSIKRMTKGVLGSHCHRPHTRVTHMRGRSIIDDHIIAT